MTKNFFNFIVDSLSRLSDLQCYLILIIGIIIVFALGISLSEEKMPHIINVIGYLLIFIACILFLAVILTAITSFIKFLIYNTIRILSLIILIIIYITLLTIV